MNSAKQNLERRDAEAIATWLVNNTSLTFEQISEFCNLSQAIIQLIADGSLKPPLQPISPIEKHLIEQEELDRCQAASSTKLEKPIGWRTDIRFIPDEGECDFVPHKVSVGKAFYLFYGRNAWHSTWINKYYDGSVEGKVKTLKNFAENQRVQGNVFNIRELPALVFQSDRFTYAVIELNARGYLSRNLDVFNGPIFIRRLIRIFKNSPPHTVLWFRMDGNIRLQEALWERDHQLKTWSSFPQGGDYPLGWREAVSQIRPDPAFDTACEMAQSMLPFSHALKQRLQDFFGERASSQPSNLTYQFALFDEHLELRAIRDSHIVRTEIDLKSADYNVFRDRLVEGLPRNRQR
jgi:hypothetical protein